MASGLKNPKVTAYAIAWVRQQRAAGRTWQAIGEDLGLTKQQMIRMEAGGVGAGQGTEDALAKLLHKGSIDALRAAAEKHWEEHPELREPASRIVEYDAEDPELRAAVEWCRGRYPDDYLQSFAGSHAKSAERKSREQYAGDIAVGYPEWRREQAGLGPSVREREPAGPSEFDEEPPINVEAAKPRPKKGKGKK